MNRSPSFFRYYWQSFRRPKALFEKLMQDDHRLRFAFMAYGLQAGIYTAVYFFLISGDGRPFKPWLPIPEAEYYRYNVFFLAPSMLLSWFLGAGAAHLLSKGPCGRFVKFLFYPVSAYVWLPGQQACMT